MATGVGGGHYSREAIIFIFMRGRAINRGTAIIRGNTVVFMIRERTLKNMVQYLRWISVHFSRYHLPLGQQTVYELHMLRFFNLLFFSWTCVIASITIKPAVPWAAFLQFLSLLGWYKSPFVTAFVLTLHPDANRILFTFCLQSPRYPRRAARLTLIQKFTLAFWHCAWIINHRWAVEDIKELCKYYTIVSKFLL